MWAKSLFFHPTLPRSFGSTLSCWGLSFSLTAAIASIVGASELYVRTGSTISLTCIIQGSGAIPPRVLFWFHDSKPSKSHPFPFSLSAPLVIPYIFPFFFLRRLVALDSPRGGISLETERTAIGMSSKLLLTRATVKDGGNQPSASSSTLSFLKLNVFLLSSCIKETTRAHRQALSRQTLPFTCSTVNDCVCCCSSLYFSLATIF